MVAANCVICGAEFEKRGNAKACSAECRAENGKAYRSEPAVRAKQLVWQREKWRNDPAWAEKKNAKRAARGRERWWNDPAWSAEQCRRWRAKRMRIQYARMRVAMFETGITI